jgi:aminotransferase
MNNIPIKQSGIRSATIKCTKLGGINLSQGICDLPTHPSIKLAAISAIASDRNTYSDFQGVYELRQKIQHKLLEFNKIKTNNINSIMVSHGSTGAYVAAVKALLNPGEEAILIEPFYGYHKQILDLHQVIIKTVKIDLNDLSIDFDQFEKIITDKTRVIVLCTPNNPSGKVFSRDELVLLGNIAQKYNLYIIADEIYEYITYPGYEHISLASIDDFNRFTITLSGLSKTYNVTGWRIGYATGPESIIERMSLVHDLLYICAPSPLQYAAITALNFTSNYYENLRQFYLAKRDQTVSYLKDMGFKFSIPQGSYFIMLDYSQNDSLSKYNDEVLANLLLNEAKVAVVPGRFFYLHHQDGLAKLRICYALNEEKMIKGLEQIKNFIKS